MADALQNPSISTPRKRILVVDDEHEITGVVVRTLERAGFEARAVNDPLLAVKVALAFRPDLVMLDFDMSKITGPEVAVQLKGALELANIPIIFLSGMIDEDHRVVATSSGSVAYLNKPLDEEELIRTIRRLT